MAHSSSSSQRLSWAGIGPVFASTGDFAREFPASAAEGRIDGEACEAHGEGESFLTALILELVGLSNRCRTAGD